MTSTTTQPWCHHSPNPPPCLNLGRNSFHTGLTGIFAFPLPGFQKVLLEVCAPWHGLLRRSAALRVRPKQNVKGPHTGSGFYHLKQPPLNSPVQLPALSRGKLVTSAGQAATSHSVSHTDKATSKTVASPEPQSRFCSPQLGSLARSELKARLLTGAGAVRAVGKGWAVSGNWGRVATESRLNSAASTRTWRHSGISGMFQVFGSGKGAGQPKGLLVGKPQPFLSRAMLGQVTGGAGDDRGWESLSSTAGVGG